MKPADIELFHVLGKPTISPDGRFAVVAVTRPDLDCDEYRGHLWIVPTDGSAAPRPFTTGWRDSAPAYSPDGDWLAFLRNGRRGHQAAALCDANGRRRAPMRDRPPARRRRPGLEPDSTKIAYLARVPDEGRYGGKPEAEPPRGSRPCSSARTVSASTRPAIAHVFVVEPFAPMTRSPSRSPAATSTTTATSPGATTASSWRSFPPATTAVTRPGLRRLAVRAGRFATAAGHPGRHRRAPQALDHLGARRSERRHDLPRRHGIRRRWPDDGGQQRRRLVSPGRRLRAARPPTPRPSISRWTPRSRRPLMACLRA